MRKEFPVATTDYIDWTYGCKLSLTPEALNRDRLRRKIIRLCNTHALSGLIPDVYGIVQDIRLDGRVYMAVVDIPEVESTARYRQDVEAGLRGKSFSIGTKINGHKPVRRDADGIIYADTVEWEVLDVIDTPFPLDVGASRDVQDLDDGYNITYQLSYNEQEVKEMVTRALNAENLDDLEDSRGRQDDESEEETEREYDCLLYTSPSPRDS